MQSGHSGDRRSRVVVQRRSCLVVDCVGLGEQRVVCSSLASTVLMGPFASLPQLDALTWSVWQGGRMLLVEVKFERGSKGMLKVAVDVQGLYFCVDFLYVVDLPLLVLDDDRVLRALDYSAQMLDQSLQVLVHLQEDFSGPGLLHLPRVFSVFHQTLAGLHLLNLTSQLCNLSLVSIRLFMHHLGDFLLHLLELGLRMLFLLFDLLHSPLHLLFFLHHFLGIELLLLVLLEHLEVFDFHFIIVSDNLDCSFLCFFVFAQALQQDLVVVFELLYQVFVRSWVRLVFEASVRRVRLLSTVSPRRRWT